MSMKVLVCDNIAKEAVDLLSPSFEVEVVAKMTEEELLEVIGQYHAVLVRSGTKITRKVIERAENLVIIGRAGVGVDNIDVEAATERGVMVVNSPQGNTISAAEHTMALLLATARRIPQAHQSMQEGRWDRKVYVGNELYNKTIGIVGFGRIGREVAVRAQSFKMRVVAYDPFIQESVAEEIGAELLSLDEVIAEADFVTIHVPKVEATENLFDQSRLAKMKPGSFLINCARGGIVDEQAVRNAVESGHLAGAAFDVYAEEPVTSSCQVVGVPGIVNTPHLAASTNEAQQRVAIDVAEQTRNVLQGGAPRAAVNMSYVPPKDMQNLKPFLPLAEKLGRFMSSYALGKIRSVRLSYCGDIAQYNVSVLTSAAIKGLLENQCSETINYVNAALVAKERNIEVKESKGGECLGYSSMVEMEVDTDQGHYSMSGSLFKSGIPRVTTLNGYEVAVDLLGTKLVTWQKDAPGVVGSVGTILGEEDVNIAEMQLGRQGARTEAIMVLSLDEVPGKETLAKLEKITGLERALLVVV